MALFPVNRLIVCVIYLLIFSAALCGEDAYTVSITGVEDHSILKAMTQASSLMRQSHQKDISPRELKALARRDMASLKQIAIHHGYHNCTIDVDVVSFPKLALIYTVHLGPQFIFSDLKIHWMDEQCVRNQVESTPTLKKMFYSPSKEEIPGFKKNLSACGDTVFVLEKQLLEILQDHGYAFAKIIDKRLSVSRKTHTTSITFDVQTGPLIRFGKTIVLGSENVSDSFFLTNQEWKEGHLFNPKYLSQTEKNLKDSGLFQTIHIELSSQIAEDWTVPVIISVVENKPRTVGAGLCYTTTYGAGVTGLWEHRNILGSGQKFSSKAEVWQKKCNALVSLSIPHWKRKDQNLTWAFEADYQNYMPFISSSFKGSMLIDKEFSKKSTTVFGGSIERLESTGIIGHKLYHLLKTPLQYRWSDAHSPLDPLSGSVLQIRFIPAWQVVSPHYTYLTQYTTFSSYKSFHDNFWTVAGKIGLGNIFGAWNRTIPLPDKFFGGSDTAMRGYKTGSVSPYNRAKKPTGGRSIVTATAEVRFRTNSGLGYVLFYDVGQVFASSLPRFKNHKFLQSVGAGIRYATPIGPIRLDLAFPLQRRKHIDPPFQLYFSVGQAF